MSPHEVGYLAYKAAGRAARNPFEREERSAAQWQRGFDKAAAEARKGRQP